MIAALSRTLRGKKSFRTSSDSAQSPEARSADFSASTSERVAAPGPLPSSCSLLEPDSELSELDDDALPSELEDELSRSRSRSRERERERERERLRPRRALSEPLLRRSLCRRRRALARGVVSGEGTCAGAAGVAAEVDVGAAGAFVAGEAAAAGGVG